jgi:hypothetical protein
VRVGSDIALDTESHSRELGSSVTYREEVCGLVLRRPPRRPLTVITALIVEVTILSHRQLNNNNIVHRSF